MIIVFAIIGILAIIAILGSLVALLVLGRREARAEHPHNSHSSHNSHSPVTDPARSWRTDYCQFCGHAMMQPRGLVPFRPICSTCESEILIESA